MGNVKLIIYVSVSSGESLSPPQNFTIARNSLSSVEVMHGFKAMTINYCCKVTVQHNVLKHSENDVETSRQCQQHLLEICAEFDGTVARFMNSDYVK